MAVVVDAQVKKRARHQRPAANWGKYHVEGTDYLTGQSFLKAAQERGYDGTIEGLLFRYRAGKCRWATLAAPVNPNISKATKASGKREREEMAELIRTLDARKREMGL